LEIPAKTNTNVISIEVGPDNIYLGLEKQLLCYNKSLTAIKRNYDFHKNETPLKLAYHNEIGSLISGTYDMCFVIKENYVSHKIPTQTKRQSPVHVAIKSLEPGEGKYFWIGTYSGLYKINNEEIVYRSDSDDEWQQSVYSILENNDNSLWLGTLNGLWGIQKRRIQ
jgi:hypothetical protein